MLQQGDFLPEKIFYIKQDLVTINYFKTFYLNAYIKFL